MLALNLRTIRSMPAVRPICQDVSLLVPHHVPSLQRYQPPTMHAPLQRSKVQAPLRGRKSNGPVRRLLHTARQLVTIAICALLLIFSSPPGYARAETLRPDLVADLPAITQMLPEGFRSLKARGERQVTPSSQKAATSKRQKTSFVTGAVDSVGPAVVRIDTERMRHAARHSTRQKPCPYLPASSSS